MPKGKNYKNAFYYFMLDWKKEQENRGCVFNSLRDVQSNSKFNDAWKNLSDEQKSYYKKKEKEERNRLQPDKKTACGEKLIDVQNSEMRKKKYIDDMKQYISLTVNEAKKNNSIKKLKFYVIHINYYYSRHIEKDSEFCPAEIGLAEFSLQEGITRTYNKIIAPKIKLGYTSYAKEYSRNTHQIPVTEKLEDGETDYSTLYTEICNFLKPGEINGTLPPLYTLYGVENIKNPVVSVLDEIASTDEKFNNNFIVYSFEELFINLHNINIEDNDEITKFETAVVSLKLKQETFDNVKNISCDYHSINSGGANHCSKSLVQRWIYVLCSYTCSLFNIDLIPGLHIPSEKAHSNQMSILNNSFETLHIQKNFISSTTSSMGAIRNQVKLPSERTYVDEQLHRSESMKKPLIIINHSAINSLVPEHSSSISPSSGINLDENNFPSIGRGTGRKNRTQSNSTFKNSYASHLK